MAGELNNNDASLWDEKRLDHDAMVKHALWYLTRNLMSSLMDAGIYRNCLTCSFFIEQMETCSVLNQRPPARVIAYGCEKHSEVIPF